MKSVRAMWMMVISLLLGLAAVAVAGKWIVERSAVDAVSVVVASREIDVGTRLSADVLTTTDWPRTSVPPGSFEEPKLLASRVAKTNLGRGEPVLESKLAPEGTTGGLSGVVAEGKRAITVRVNDVVGVAGFALPGNKVDILVNTKDENDKPISKIVLEQILLLAVAQDLGRDETKPKVVNAVTLEVTPEQAEKLDLARSIGTLSLALRNQIDSTPVTTAGVRTKDLLMLTAAAKPAPGPRKPAVVGIEIIRGTAQTKETPMEKVFR
jgi:pilus assembly protein CpaB